MISSPPHSCGETPAQMVIYLSVILTVNQNLQILAGAQRRLRSDAVGLADEWSVVQKFSKFNNCPDSGF